MESRTGIRLFLRYEHISGQVADRFHTAADVQEMVILFFEFINDTVPLRHIHGCDLRISLLTGSKTPLLEEPHLFRRKTYKILSALFFSRR